MHVFSFLDWIASIVIGFFVVTYWRCTWTLMDLWTCGQPEDATLAGGNTFCLFVDSTLDPEVATMRFNSASLSYGLGIGCLALGVFMVWMGWWVPLDDEQKVTPLKALVRFVTIYILGFGTVNIWRGIWYWADDWILPLNFYASILTTSLVGSTLCFSLCAGNSLLAPPSVFLLDGPELGSPPVAVTLLSSHFSVSLPATRKPPPLSLPVKIADVLISFILLPFGVVWFWRGSWLLLDYWFWGLTPSDDDINISLLYSFLLALEVGLITSEPVIGLLDRHIESKSLLSMLTRLRSYLMAWGTVGFWRLVWLIWDQFLGGATTLSASLGHVTAIVALTSMGCVSSICAPPSTMGVDTIPSENAADALLFSMLPVPYESLHFLGIARQPVIPKGSGEGIEMKAIKEHEQLGVIPEDQKKLHSRLNDQLQLVDDTVLVEAAASGSSTGENSNSEIIVENQQHNEMETSRDQSSELGFRTSWTSSRRGWHPEGSFRSYSELQRFGSHTQSTRSDYAQRPGKDNKRTRSKFFRSR